MVVITIKTNTNQCFQVFYKPQTCSHLRWIDLYGVIDNILKAACRHAMFAINVSYFPFQHKWFLTEDHIKAVEWLWERERSNDFLRFLHRINPWFDHCNSSSLCVTGPEEWKLHRHQGQESQQGSWLTVEVAYEFIHMI